jgi:hypothetical protein
MSEEKYVVVTTISSFHHHYCIPVSELQKLNPDVPVKPEEWAMDSVTCEDVEEMSQRHIGETIINSSIHNEQEILALFRKENTYLSTWSDEQIINYIFKWRKNQ